MLISFTYFIDSTNSVKSFVWPSPLSLAVMRRGGGKTNVPHPQAHRQRQERLKQTLFWHSSVAINPHPPQLFSPSVNITPPLSSSVHSFRHLVWRGATHNTQERTRTVFVQWQTCFVYTLTGVVCFCPSIYNRLCPLSKLIIRQNESWMTKNEARLEGRLNSVHL